MLIPLGVRDVCPVAVFLKQAGFTRKYQRHVYLPQPPVQATQAPHDEWQMDAQGVTKVDGVGKVSVIPIIDVVSRLKVESCPRAHISKPAADDYWDGYDFAELNTCTIAQLHHPHIISVHDFGFENDTPYLVMEYIQGSTLRERFPKGTHLPFEQIVTKVSQIASAVDYAHEQHVIHRDIKPENILLGASQEAILSDFGIAVVQNTWHSLSMQSPAGTPIYMAPEQIQHKSCKASDQYALGVMVYEWLCGEPPFHGQLFEVFSQHLHKPPPRLRTRLPQLPAAVEDAVFAALAKDPRQRFTSVTDFATALSEACFATQLLLPHESVEYEPQNQTPHSFYSLHDERCNRQKVWFFRRLDTVIELGADSGTLPNDNSDREKNEKEAHKPSQ